MKEFLRRKLSVYLYHKAYSRAFFTNYGIAIQEARSSFKQFFTWKYPLSSFLRSLKYLVMAILRIVTGRSVRYSYSFTGEDRLIESILKPIITRTGFYIDVGCNEPRFISNSFLFYRRGWRGVTIDPNVDLIKKHKKIRPKDCSVVALVSDLDQELEYIEYTNNTLSSVDKSIVDGYLNEGQKVVRRTMMKTRTLTSILDQCNAPSQIDFLSIDAEEHDFNVLKSLDLQKYSPKLIIMELEDFVPANPSSHPVYIYLIERGYEYAGFVLKNCYFLRVK